MFVRDIVAYSEFIPLNSSIFDLSIVILYTILTFQASGAKRLVSRFIIIVLCMLSIVGSAIAATQPATALSLSHQQFIDKLLPAIYAKNQQIATKRARLLELEARYQQQQTLGAIEQIWLTQLAQDYRLSFNETDPNAWTRLKKRVDGLPPSLVLAQAINESGWGKSRFAKQGNNYFGQWCYQSGCGIVPAQRPAGKKYEVKAFKNIAASIAQYYRNLNTNHAYQLLRQKRARARQQGILLNSQKLAQGLLHYSQRKQAYVESIKKLIQRFHLHQYDIVSKEVTTPQFTFHLLPFFHRLANA